MSQHSNLPDVPGSAGDLWASFSADPRRHPAMRASDADRDIAAEALNVAFSDGRLDSIEHTDRLHAALGAKQLGDLVPLLDDITLSARPKPPVPTRRKVQDGAVRSWIGLAILFNVIWVATWLFAGRLPYYYWPIWPMIGTAVPMVITWLAAAPSGKDDPKGIEGPKR